MFFTLVLGIGVVTSGLYSTIIIKTKMLHCCINKFCYRTHVITIKGGRRI